MFRSLIISAALLTVSSVASAQTSTTKPAPSAPAATTMGPAKAPATAGSAASGSVAQYSSQTDATAKCGSDTVVWANATSKALHPSGDRYFGKSKHGFFTCEKDAMAAGYHMAGHRKHAVKST